MNQRARKQAGLQVQYHHPKRKVAGSVADYYADADVTRGGCYMSSGFFGAGTRSDRFSVCDWDGLGTYKVGPTCVSGYTWGYALFDDTDRTTKSFHVRGKAKAGFSTARKGKYDTVKVSAKYYSPNAYGYSYFSQKSVRIQRRATGGWKTIKTVNLKKRKASYRAIVPQYSKTTSATSATSRR